MSGDSAHSYLPLCLIRLWCRQTDSWLAFTTGAGDRYLVGADGYFIEMPNGVLAPIGCGVAFQRINRCPSVQCCELAVNKRFGPEARLVASSAGGASSQQVLLPETFADTLVSLGAINPALTPMENHLALRLIEYEAISNSTLQSAIDNRGDTATLGQSLMKSKLCSWERMLSACLDVRLLTAFDPPAMRTNALRKEWELIGEVLITIGKLSRTKLEEALQVKREGSRALGEILQSMGAVTEAEITRCLQMQKQLRKESSSGVALVGQLLLARGIISAECLEDVVRHQKIGRQSLEKILVSMGACTERDIEDFVAAHKWQGFQDEIDDIKLGQYLEKIGKINRQQLDEALRLQMRGRQVLGEMLVSLHLCNAQDVVQALKLQEEVRADYASDIEKLGTILLKTGKVEPAKLDQALRLQSTGRRRLGSILLALGAASETDINQALTLQHQWREKSTVLHDRLGDLLSAHGVITPEELTYALRQQSTSHLPLGRILIDEQLCTPEQVLAAVIARDDRRQTAFRTFVKRQLAAENPVVKSVPKLLAEQKGRPATAGKIPPLVVEAPIPNFRQVHTWMYRGGQPDAAGLQYLASLNIRTVLSLRWSAGVINAEQKQVCALGMNYVSIPLNYWTFPSLKQIEYFLSIVDDEAKRPVYIHCKHGADRTGVILAAYRIAREGWSAEEAYLEMKRCGFHLIRMYHFKWAVYLFARQLDRLKSANF